MKIILTVVLSTLMLVSFSQSEQALVLKWKIAKTDTLKYSTEMNEIDTNSVTMNFGVLSKLIGDSLSVKQKQITDFFNKFNSEFSKQNYLSLLTNRGNNVIDIVVIAKEKDKATRNKTDTSVEKKSDFLSLMRSMNQGIILRGSVYASGGVQSFWIKSSQKNLISALFELPSRPVRVGDKWPLNINFIANDQNFECDSAYRVNEVTLSEIKVVNADTIAMLKYNVLEYVQGNFNMPAGFGHEEKRTKTIMKLMHNGVAEFSVGKGRWISYDAIMTVEATGVMTGNKKTKFSLREEKE